ncbi:MAG TPA: alpha/beta hydrolase [Candidatus Didemnitutus sp.]|nr:alpha/beta hydrolase [Candidatus Didemnitutus sp.]
MRISRGARIALIIISLAAASSWIANGVSRHRDARLYAGPPDGVVRFVEVDHGVSVEVVDFGGSGRAIILLPGLNGTAHHFAGFAARLSHDYHVYGITPRGWCAGCTPCRGYSVRRLGDDVVAVIEALRIRRPVLVGQSIAGATLSSVANRHPDEIAGVIYLDAGEFYALYDEKDGSPAMALMQIAKWLTAPLPAELLPRVVSMSAGLEKFTTIPVPALAVFAEPHSDLRRQYKNDPEGLRKAEEKDAARVERQVAAFERQVPTCRVIRIPHGAHDIIESNRDEVLRVIREFVAILPLPADK